MMCIFATFKTHCPFGFWKDALMADPRLQANSSLPGIKRVMGTLTWRWGLSPGDALTEAGVPLSQREAKTPKVLALPAEFAERLARNSKPEIRNLTDQAEFQARSNAFRTDCLAWITEAKTDPTRQKRIEETVAWTAEGKGGSGIDQPEVTAGTRTAGPGHHGGANGFRLMRHDSRSRLHGAWDSCRVNVRPRWIASEVCGVCHHPSALSAKSHTQLLTTDLMPPWVYRWAARGRARQGPSRILGHLEY